jgi:hypothetical protein
LKTIMLIVDHGLTLANFLLTDLAGFITEKDVRLVLLVQDELIPRLREDFCANPRLVFESSREPQTLEYQNSYRPGVQEMMEYLRKSSMDPKVPLTYVDTHRQRKEYEAKGRWRYMLKAAHPAINVLRKYPRARRMFINAQHDMFTTNIYTNLLDRYKPDLVLSATAGWRLDRYLLREAHQRHIPTGMVVVGWDNPSAHGLPGAWVDYASVWSSVHKWELSAGLDWPEKNIFVGGFPLYDGYLQKKWVVRKEEYYREHALNPHRKLISYVATALSISPNLHIVEALTDLIAGDKLSEPAQLLIRLHPNHFKPAEHYQREREAILEVARRSGDVHVVAPKALGGGLPRYSGEDFPEKASMLTYSDVIVSIYSTMVLEAALHDKPIVSVCIDSPVGWPDNFWIPLSTVPSWPTAARVNRLGASRNAFNVAELTQTIDAYLENPRLDSENRHNFVQQELTYLHGESARRTADFILSLVYKDPRHAV